MPNFMLSSFSKSVGEKQFQIQKGYEELAVCGDGEP